MDQNQIIIDIEVRAKRLRLPIYTLCKESGVHPTTFSKWKNGVDARISGIKKLMDTLDHLEAVSAQAGEGGL